MNSSILFLSSYYSSLNNFLSFSYFSIFSKNNLSHSRSFLIYFSLSSSSLLILSLSISSFFLTCQGPVVPERRRRWRPCGSSCSSRRLTDCRQLQPRARLFSRRSAIVIVCCTSVAERLKAVCKSISPSFSTSSKK